MTIHYMHTAEGGFLAGDTSTCLTAYAYPTSTYAEQAKRDPAKVAAKMIAEESSTLRFRNPAIADQDAARLEQLRAHNA